MLHNQSGYLFCQCKNQSDILLSWNYEVGVVTALQLVMCSDKLTHNCSGQRFLRACVCQ